MSNLVSQLTTLKEELEKRKLAKAEGHGRLKELYRQLKEMGCDSKEDGDRLLQDLEIEIELLEEEISQGLEEVQSKLGLLDGR